VSLDSAPHLASTFKEIRRLDIVDVCCGLGSPAESPQVGQDFSTFGIIERLLVRRLAAEKEWWQFEQLLSLE
jgi:hypothetical protein